MQYELDGIHYWTYGDRSKPPLLLIHGFTGSHEGFQYIVPDLKKNYFIIAPDLSGFGESVLDFKPWTIDALARRTNLFVQSLKLTSRPIVLSHSMGGLVAASMLSQNPELFAHKTIFISPVSIRVGRVDSRKIGATLGALHYNVGKRSGGAGQRLVRSPLICRVTTNLIMTTKDTQLRQTIHQHHLKNLEYISSIDYYHQLHIDINRHGAIDYKQPLKQFDILIIAGDKDKVTPLRGEQMLADELGAELSIIAGVGHLTHYEKPRQLTTRLLGFLE